METKNYSDFRANLKTALDMIVYNHEPLIVKRQQGEDVVVMSLSDYNSHKETVSLLSKPANAIKLMQSIAEHRAEKTNKIDINELDKFINQ